MADHDMVEYLRFVNSRERLYTNHSQYIERFIQVGTFEGSELRVRAETELAGRQVVLAGDFGGFPVQRLRSALEPAGVVLADHVTADTDRIFVMFGAGHIWTLRQFFEDHPGFDLVPVAEILR